MLRVLKSKPVADIKEKKNKTKKLVCRCVDL